MPPPAPKLNCTTPVQLKDEIENIRRILEPAETEDNWEKMEKGIERLAELTKGGAYKFENYVNLVSRGYNGGLTIIGGSIGEGIVKCLLSDRSRLSFTTLSLLNNISPRLKAKFLPLVALFFPPLLKVLLRPSKLNTKETTKTLLTIISFCHLPSIIPYLIRSSEEKFDGCRKAVADCLNNCLRSWERDVWFESKEGKGKAEMIEGVMKTLTRDRNPDVRKVAKEIWASYQDIWPERVDAFIGPLTPVTRKILDVGKESSVASSARVQKALVSTSRPPATTSAGPSKASAPAVLVPQSSSSSSSGIQPLPARHVSSSTSKITSSHQQQPASSAATVSSHLSSSSLYLAPSTHVIPVSLLPPSRAAVLSAHAAQRSQPLQHPHSSSSRSGGVNSGGALRTGVNPHSLASFMAGSQPGALSSGPARPPKSKHSAADLLATPANVKVALGGGAKRGPIREKEFSTPAPKQAATSPEKLKLKDGFKPKRGRACVNGLEDAPSTSTNTNKITEESIDKEVQKVEGKLVEEKTVEVAETFVEPLENTQPELATPEDLTIESGALFEVVVEPEVEEKQLEDPKTEEEADLASAPTRILETASGSAPSAPMTVNNALSTSSSEEHILLASCTSSIKPNPPPASAPVTKKLSSSTASKPSTLSASTSSKSKTLSSSTSMKPTAASQSKVKPVIRSQPVSASPAVVPPAPRQPRIKLKAALPSFRPTPSASRGGPPKVGATKSTTNAEAAAPASKRPVVPLSSVSTTAAITRPSRKAEETVADCGGDADTISASGTIDESNEDLTGVVFAPHPSLPVVAIQTPLPPSPSATPAPQEPIVSSFTPPSTSADKTVLNPKLSAASTVVRSPLPVSPAPPATSSAQPLFSSETPPVTQVFSSQVRVAASIFENLAASPVTAGTPSKGTPSKKGLGMLAARGGTGTPLSEKNINLSGSSTQKRALAQEV